ncbi:MAG: CopG family transcriptional regulator [Thermodesulfobacteriota bacterium]|nr:CopG family transcriptional regulator [Thermodesulfobacteriota bacterium]
MIRTQIYLDEGQKVALGRLSAERHAPVSDLIRQAVDQFIGRVSSDFEEALEKSFGVWRHRGKFGDSSKYVRNIRNEWKNREKRI